jgi:hypothetical protein
MGCRAKEYARDLQAEEPTYEDQRPDSWTTYDRIASASDQLRFLINMRGIPEQLRLVLGPQNQERLTKLLDCIDANLFKMGELGLGWAVTVFASSIESSLFQRVLDLRTAGQVNEAWNLVEAWATGKELPEED